MTRRTKYILKEEGYILEPTCFVSSQYSKILNELVNFAKEENFIITAPVRLHRALLQNNLRDIENEIVDWLGLDKKQMEATREWLASKDFQRLRKRILTVLKDPRKLGVKIPTSITGQIVALSSARHYGIVSFFNFLDKVKEKFVKGWRRAKEEGTRIFIEVYDGVSRFGKWLNEHKKEILKKGAKMAIHKITGVAEGLLGTFLPGVNLALDVGTDFVDEKIDVIVDP